MAERVVIKARENGPYKITGPVTVIDTDGVEYELPDDGRPLALCRCGGSTTKPFCDGTHSRIGFQAAERAVRDEQLRPEAQPAPPDGSLESPPPPPPPRSA